MVLVDGKWWWLLGMIGVGIVLVLIVIITMVVVIVKNLDWFNNGLGCGLGEGCSVGLE